MVAVKVDRGTPSGKPDSGLVLPTPTQEACREGALREKAEQGLLREADLLGCLWPVSIVSISFVECSESLPGEGRVEFLPLSFDFYPDLFLLLFYCLSVSL